MSAPSSLCAGAAAPAEGSPTIAGLGCIFTWLSRWFEKEDFWLEDLPPWLQTQGVSSCILCAHTCEGASKGSSAFMTSHMMTKGLSSPDAFAHRWHSYGSSPVWMSPWLWRNEDSLKALSWSFQIKGFSPMWGLIGGNKSWPLMKDLTHSLHFQDFFYSVIFGVYTAKAPAELFPSFTTFIGVSLGWVLSYCLSLEHRRKLSRIDSWTLCNKIRLLLVKIWIKNGQRLFQLGNKYSGFLWSELLVHIKQVVYLNSFPHS